MSDTEISAEVETAIEAVVREELGRFGVSEVETIEAEDADGDASIMVLIHYESPASEPDPRVASALITKLNDRLYALKEKRFAYILHRVPEAPRPVRRRRQRAA